MFIFKYYLEFCDKLFWGNECFLDLVEKILIDLGLLVRKGIVEGWLIFDLEEVLGMIYCGLLN